jgi:hypothetical protein
MHTTQPNTNSLDYELDELMHFNAKIMKFTPRMQASVYFEQQAKNY